MTQASKYKYPPMELPQGSGIWGRPALADNLKHLAYYSERDDTWTTWCGQEVPPDHKCPPIGRRPDGTAGPVLSCLECYTRYADERARIADTQRRAEAYWKITRQNPRA